MSSWAALHKRLSSSGFYSILGVTVTLRTVYSKPYSNASLNAAKGSPFVNSSYPYSLTALLPSSDTSLNTRLFYSIGLKISVVRSYFKNILEPSSKLSK